MISEIRNKVLIMLTLFAFLFTFFPSLNSAQSNEVQLGEMMGFVYAKDMKTPVKNVQIVLMEIKDKKDKSERKEFRSDLTGEKGDYKIDGISPGTYKIKIKVRNQLYKIKKVDFIIKIFGGKSSFISFSLRKRSVPPIAWVITGTAICKAVTKYKPPKEASPTTR